MTLFQAEADLHEDLGGNGRDLTGEVRLVAQPLHDLGFVLGEDLGLHLVDPKFLRYRQGRRAAIPREHDDAHAGLAQTPEGGRGRGLDGVGDGHKAGEPTVQRHEDHRGRLGTLQFGGGLERTTIKQGTNIPAAYLDYARRFGYGVVRDFTGHGIGETFHNGLVVLHYDEPSVQTLLEPGMAFTIEPMINLGSLDYEIWEDGWTVATRDRKWTAQFEHTLVVTEDGAEILTLP